MPQRAAYMTDEVFAIVGGAEVEGNALRLDGAYDRKTYLKVNQVLETLGGKWNKKAKAHLFDRCPRAVIAAAMGEESEAEAPAELERDRIKRLQFYQTPEPLARRMAKWAVKPGGTVLEPEAGRGRLAMAALDADAGYVIGVDIDEANYRALVADPDLNRDRTMVEWWCADFLERAEDWLASPVFQGFDAVVMNPPFRGNQDIRHVLAAARLLKPGGRLAAVMSPHFTFAEDRESVDFRERLDRRGLEVEVLPGGTFKEEGTEISAVLLTLQREC